MTVDPARLLQMLEPTVRPGATSAGGGAQQATPAFENQSFENLLRTASGAAATEEGTGEGSPVKGNPLDGLSGLGQIENATLRRVLTEARRSGGDSGQTI